MFVCFGVSVRIGNSLEQHRQVIGGFYSACKIKKAELLGTMGGWSWFMAGICRQSKSKQLCWGQGNLKQNMTKLTIGRWAVPGSLSLSRFWELLSWPRLANLMLMTKSRIETNPGPCTNPTNDDTLKWFENLQIVNIILHEDQKVYWFVVFGMSFLKPGLVSIECFFEHFFRLC